MGTSESGQQVQPHASDPGQLQKLIVSSLQNSKLSLNHQTNIFQKCQYLLQNYNKYRQQFEQLYLTHNMISTQFMNMLARMPVGNLKVLCLSHNDIACEGVKSIKDMPLKTLQYLYLDNNQIGDDGCSYLTRASLPYLVTLDLTNNRIKDDGCRHLARGVFPNLRTLLISGNKFGEKGLRFLALGEWQLLAFVQAKNNGFQPTKQLQGIKFRSEVKVFRLEIQ